MKKETITLAGTLGSGKSSTAKRVASTLDYRHFSSGDLFRRIAAERGLSVEAINLTAEQQQDIDHQVDDLLKKMGREEQHLVIDSRLAWYWMPESFKVFLNLDQETAAQRIFNQIKHEGRVSQTGESVEEILKNIRIRRESEQKRYMNLYHVDINDLTPFDLVIDTKIHDLETVVDMVLNGYHTWLAKE